MDKQTFVVVLLIISIVLSAVTVIMAFAASPDSMSRPQGTNYIVERTTIQGAPQSGGIGFQLVGGGG